MIGDGRDPSEARKIEKAAASDQRIAEERAEAGLAHAGSFEAVAREWLSIAQCFAALALVSVLWVVLGYTLAFGPDKGGIIGGLDFIGLRDSGQISTITASPSARSAAPGDFGPRWITHARPRDTSGPRNRAPFTVPVT